MNDIKFVAATPLGAPGKLYINGVEVPGVLGIQPDLFSRGDVSSVTVTLAVNRVEYVKADKQ